MKPLSKPRVPAVPSVTTESGLFPVPARYRQDADTLPAPRSIHEAETVRARAYATTRPAHAKADINYDVAIPPSPRMPFNLKPRVVSKNRWRADLLVEWVKLSTNDSRCE